MKSILLSILLLTLVGCSEEHKPIFNDKDDIVFSVESKDVFTIIKRSGWSCRTDWIADYSTIQVEVSGKVSAESPTHYFSVRCTDDPLVMKIREVLDREKKSNEAVELKTSEDEGSEQ